MYLSSKTCSKIGKVAKLGSVTAIISAAVVSLSSESSEQVGNALDKSEISNSGPDQKKLFALGECTRNKGRFLVDGLHEDKTKTIHGSNGSKAKVNPRNNNLYVHIGGANKPYHIRLDQENKVGTLNGELEGNEIADFNESLHILFSECEKKTRKISLSETFDGREYSNERTFKDFNGLNEFCYHVRGRELTSPSQAKTAQKYDAFIKLGDVTIDFNGVDILEKDSCGLEGVSISFNNFYGEKIEYQLSKNGSFQLFFKGNGVRPNTKDIPDLDQERRIPNLDDFIEFIIDHVKKTHGDFSIQAHPQEEVPDGSIIDSASRLIIPDAYENLVQDQILGKLRVCTRDRGAYGHYAETKRTAIRDAWEGKTYGDSTVYLDMRSGEIQISYKWYAERRVVNISFGEDKGIKDTHGGEFVKNINGEEKGKIKNMPTGKEGDYLGAIIKRLLGSCESKEQRVSTLGTSFVGASDSMKLITKSKNNRNYGIMKLKGDKGKKIFEELKWLYTNSKLVQHISPRYENGKSAQTEINGVRIEFHTQLINDSVSDDNESTFLLKQVAIYYRNYYNEAIQHTITIEFIGDDDYQVDEVNVTVNKSDRKKIDYPILLPETTGVVEEIIKHVENNRL